MKRGLGLLLLVAVVSGCPEDNRLDFDLAGEFVARTCRTAAECQTALSEDSCAPSVDASSWRHLAEQINRGAVGADSGAADRCLSLLAPDACVSRNATTDLEILNVCGRAFSGTLQPGQHCLADGECAVGSCEKIDADDPCSNKVCSLPSASEASCANIPCAPNSRCVATETGLFCVARTPLGERCSVGSCAVGTVCSPASRRCVFKGLLGQRCLPELGDRSCARASDYCDETRERCLPRRGLLAPCSAARPCAPYASCGAGVCLPLPGLGDACSESIGCLGDLVCSSERCVLPNTACQP